MEALSKLAGLRPTTRDVGENKIAPKGLSVPEQGSDAAVLQAIRELQKKKPEDAAADRAQHSRLKRLIEVSRAGC
jgi:hypothetical protein